MLSLRSLLPVLRFLSSLVLFLYDLMKHMIQRI